MKAVADCGAGPGSVIPRERVEEAVATAAITDNKRLSAVLEQIKRQQAAYPARQQRGHEARRRPPNNLEAPGLPSKGRAPRRSAAALSA